MKPWELLATSQLPDDGKTLKLYLRDTEYSIRVDYTELMNSRVHGSEEALAEIAADKLTDKPVKQVLIGGLGMGFTLRAALDSFDSSVKIVVAELSSAVIEWNKKFLSPLANSPLEDSRVEIFNGDVRDAIKQHNNHYDVILLDVDNGPEGLTAKSNNALYSNRGIKLAHSALVENGILAVWSSGVSDLFTQRLKQCGFKTSVERVPQRKAKHTGGRHVLWFGEKTDRGNK